MNMIKHVNIIWPDFELRCKTAVAGLCFHVAKFGQLYENRKYVVFSYLLSVNFTKWEIILLWTKSFVIDHK